MLKGVFLFVNRYLGAGGDLFSIRRRLFGWSSGFRAGFCSMKVNGAGDALFKVLGGCGVRVRGSGDAIGVVLLYGWKTGGIRITGLSSDFRGSSFTCFCFETVNEGASPYLAISLPSGGMLAEVDVAKFQADKGC